MNAFLILAALLPIAYAQTCSNTGIGPCLSNTICPPGNTCINSGTASAFCCAAAFVVTCSDKLNPSTGVSDCPRMAGYCNNSAYYTLMTEQCPKTCGRCNGGTVTTTTVASTCVDKINPATGRSDCPSKSYLCSNSAYYALMTQECPRTCGRCTVGK